MSDEFRAPDPYDAVLADLRAKRDQIDQTIALLSALRLGGTASGVMPVTQENAIVETAGMFLGMSIVDGAKKLLALRKQTMGNAEIAKELQAGGMVLTSAEPANVVGSVLTRRFQQVGDVVKLGRGIWGLKEWYPGRSFKPTMKIVQGVPMADMPPMSDEQKAMAEANKAVIEPEDCDGLLT